MTNPYLDSMTNERRREWAAAQFAVCMRHPESEEAKTTADVLCAAARGGSTYMTGQPQINPLYTRRLATMLVGWLAIHGWSFPYNAPPHWSPGACTITPSDLDAPDLAGFLFHRDVTP